MFTKKEISNFIFQGLSSNKEILKKQFNASKETIGYFFIDDLLPDNLAKAIYDSFPDISLTKKRKDLREFKYVGYEMDDYKQLLKDVLYAFQEEKIVNLIAEICSFKNIFADEYLYAGGLSLMGKNNFLNPHLDNSHDKDRDLWRVLNLLYYVTPEWRSNNGGDLELWDKGLNSEPIIIESKFNRLVVMVTHQKSWHSVSKVLVDKFRCCVSNYYFSEEPALASDTFHITTFRGRPKENIKNMVLKIDTSLRSGIRKVFKKGIRENPHQYKKEKEIKF